MATSPFIIVAIDGGAASGKSSSSRILADQFNLLHVDTGSFYRHITAELLRRQVQLAGWQDRPFDIVRTLLVAIGGACPERIGGFEHASAEHE